MSLRVCRAQCVEDKADVGWIARAEQVGYVVDDDDWCLLVDDVLLDVVEDAAAVELCGGEVGVERLDVEHAVACCEVVLVGVVARLELVGSVLEVEV